MDEFMDELASSKCPICALDSPHFHEDHLLELERHVRPAFEFFVAKNFGEFPYRTDQHYQTPYVGNWEALWQAYRAAWFTSRNNRFGFRFIKNLGGDQVPYEIKYEGQT